MDKLYIGTSGWSYSSWIGVFYKSSRGLLRQYSRVFNTVEMDSTFYSIPSEDVVRSIAKVLPSGFKVSVKMPNLITHKNLLGRSGPVESILNRFLDVLKPFKIKNMLGVILIQLPPGLGYDYKLLSNFLNVLDYDFRYAIEFRDVSWLRDDIYELLRRYNVAYTIVDEPLLPPDIVVTADFSYIRWHGRGSRPWYNYRYRIDELKEWVPKVKDVSSTVDEVYCYFNNHFHGYAVENALEIMDMFGLLDERGREILNEVRRNIEKPPTLKRIERISYDKVMKMNILDLLQLLAGKNRFERGIKIDTRDVKIIEDTNNLIIAKVRDYDITIDLDNKVIIHNCGDWERAVVEKRLCKHLVKLLTLINRDKSVKLLRDLILNRDLWTFEFGGGEP